MHFFPGMIQDPSRAVLAPCRPLPLRGKWSVRTQGGLGWLGVCAVPWMDLIVSISQHYVYIYINVNSFIRIIGTRWCRPPFSYRTPVPVLITWEESGASALLELGTGAAAIWDIWHRASTCPSSSTYALKYSIPVIIYLSVKRQVLKQPFPHHSNISKIDLPSYLIIICCLESPIPIKLSLIENG